MPPRRSASPRREKKAAPAAAADDSLLSVILPTYNERENLPIIVWLLVRELTKWCACLPALASLCAPRDPPPSRPLTLSAATCASRS
jgi:hypothetical protein